MKYNSRQTREDRKITDYFKKISDNSKKTLFVKSSLNLEIKNIGIQKMINQT